MPAASPPAPAARAIGDGVSIRLAVLDRDSGFAAVLGKRLRDAGWPHRVLTRAPSVDELVALRLGALVLDLEPLGPGGWRYLEQVCAALPSLAVVVCTRPSTVGERVHGLRAGADDWMSKPCHPEELMARVEAVLRRRRSSSGGDQEPLSAGELSIHPGRYQAFVGERSLDLTRREFELLHLLATSAGEVVAREEIYERVWGYAMAHGDRSVDVFVRKARQKLQRASPGWRYVHTHFGVGYRFDAEPEDTGAATDPGSPPARAGAARSTTAA